MSEGLKSKQIRPNTTDDGAVAGAVVQLDATAKLPVLDGSQLTGISGSSADFSKLLTTVTASMVVDNNGDLVQKS